jgi:hypothetical protein
MTQTLTNAPVSAAAEACAAIVRGAAKDCVVQVLLRDTEIAALIQSGWLEERSRNDPRAVTDALHRVGGCKLANDGCSNAARETVFLKCDCE